MSVVRVSDAIKKYQSKNDATVVLQSFNMNVTAETIYSFIGPSGCGKTTLISSLVGIVTLDCGTIEIFGKPPKTYRSRIGYMPQENALVSEFSVREMIWFFGMVFGMHAKKIRERFEFLSDLLELPDGCTIIRDCSGGQQRRISFAVTLIHEPELLILDEPTVGLDPLLRVKIWDYLLEITSKQHVTVLLTTHYVEEARHSTHIGLMRNGTLVAEDSPQMILDTTESLSLEEAFLKLCQKQRTTNVETSASFTKMNETTASTNERLNEELFRESKAKYILALTSKNFLQLFRNIDVLLAALGLPIIACFVCTFSLMPISNISLGIVNQEVPSHENCFNESMQISNAVQIDDMDCQLPKLSCEIIKAIPSEIFIKKFYSNVDEAFEDAKKGNIAGFIHFSENFTQSLILISDDGVENSDDDGTIRVHFDNTEFFDVLYSKKAIFKAYETAFGKEMVQCGLHEKIGSANFDFGDFDENLYDFRPTLVPGLMMCFLFLSSTYLLINSISYDQQEGIWNRCLVAGVKPVHFLLAHVIEGMVIMLAQVTIVSTYSIFFMRTTLSLKAAGLTIILLLFNGTAGTVFGLLCSIVIEDLMGSIYVSQMIAFTTFLINGIIWPMEAIPTGLKYIGYAFPGAFPTIAFRNIFAKDCHLSDSSYGQALMVLSAWIIISLSICFWKLRERN